MPSASSSGSLQAHSDSCSSDMEPVLSTLLSLSGDKYLAFFFVASAFSVASVFFASVLTLLESKSPLSLLDDEDDEESLLSLLDEEDDDDDDDDDEDDDEEDDEDDDEVESEDCLSLSDVSCFCFSLTASAVLLPLGATTAASFPGMARFCSVHLTQRVSGSSPMAARCLRSCLAWKKVRSGSRRHRCQHSNVFFSVLRFECVGPF